MKPRLLYLLVLAVLASLIVSIPVRADELHLQDGSVLNGQLIAADEQSIVFKTANTLLTKSRGEVNSIVLGARTVKTGGLPPGVSVAQGLSVKRWITFKHITNFQRGADAKFISNAKISANGAKIVFSALSGTYVINTDGSSMIRLDDKRNDGYIDISADARKIAWYAGGSGLFVANSDGSGLLKMPGGQQVEALRMTAGGDRLFIIASGAIYTLPTDGSGVHRLVNTEQVAKVAGTDANGNFWRRGPWSLDISDNGSRLVFQFLWDAFAMNGDGGELRKLTRFDGYSLKMLNISGDGRKIAYYQTQPESTVTVMDWNGGGPLVYSGRFADSGDWMQFSRDAGAIALSWGVRMFSGNHKEFWSLDDIGGVWGPNPFNRITTATMTGDHRRLCMLIDGMESVDQGRPSQIVIAEIDPASIGGAIPPANIDISPRFALNDGSTQAVVAAQIDDANLQFAGTLPMRDGMRLGDWSGSNLALKKSADKAKAANNIFESDPLWLRTNTGKPVPAGPLTMRVFTVSKDGTVFIVEVEGGLEARQP